jgi:hypothetical protein
MADFKVTADLIKYDVNFTTYDVSGYVTSDCNSILFINYGSNAVQIENVTLQQNQSLQIEGNAGEFTTRRFFANFINSGGFNNLVTVKKNYIL